jgi:hypothetical protein
MYFYIHRIENHACPSDKKKKKTEKENKKNMKARPRTRAEIRKS